MVRVDDPEGLFQSKWFCDSTRSSVKQCLNILNFTEAVYYQSQSQYYVGWPIPRLFCWKWENWVHMFNRSYLVGDKCLWIEFTHLAPCAFLKSCQVVEKLNCLLLMLYHSLTRETKAVRDSCWYPCHHPVLLVMLWFTWKQDGSRVWFSLSL